MMELIYRENDYMNDKKIRDLVGNIMLNFDKDKDQCLSYEEFSNVLFFYFFFPY